MLNLKSKTSLYKYISSHISLPFLPPFQAPTLSKIRTIHDLIPKLENSQSISQTEYLINLMYSTYKQESFFYLSNICIMITYKQYSLPFQSYILDKCYNNLKFSLFVTLLLKSFPFSSKIQSLLYHLEECISFPSRTKNINIKINKSISNNKCSIYSCLIMKESNVNYYLSCLDFYDNLQKLCILLYNYPITAKENEVSRDKVLKGSIKYINEDIQTMRKENYISIMKHTNQIDMYNKKRKYNKGYLLPFDNPISNSDTHSYIIVNIIPEYSLCFNTKERVPIKLCCECIEMNECEDFYSLYDDNNFYNTCVKEIEKEKEKEQIVNNNNNNDNKNNDDDNKSSQNKFNLTSTSFWLSQQISMFDSQKVKIFDKWVNLEMYLKNENSSTILNEHIEQFNKQEWIEENNPFNDFVIIGLNLEIINPFGKPLSQLEKELKSKSAFSKFKSYTIKQFIAKANDDLKQEMFTMQLIKLFAKAFEGTDIYISTYDILLTSTTSGLVELVPNSSSIHGILKKISDKGWNLETFFRKYYSSDLQQAQLNFANSLAGFCLLSYFLDIKDRHNGNILLDNKGRISHIDFGFVLGLSPKNMHFEKAQFKLTQDYINILDGFDSELFNHFKKQIVKGIIIARKYYNVFKTLINTMSYANLLCFQYKSKNEIIKTFYLKFMFNKSHKEVEENVNMLIKDSFNNFWTNQYDNFQKIMNGIKC